MCDGNPYEQHENCNICGQDAAICQCPVCPVCQWQGEIKCFLGKEPHMPLSALIAALEAPGLDNSDAGIVLDILGLIFSDYESPSHLASSIYDNTNCGAWIEFLTCDSCLANGNLPDRWNGKFHYGIYGFRVGSIVEGSDEGTPAHDVPMFPLSTVKDRLFAELDLVEEEAKAIWEDTHGCSDCGLNGAINPECPTCKGTGTVI